MHGQSHLNSQSLSNSYAMDDKIYYIYTIYNIYKASASPGFVLKFRLFLRSPR
jgi:hypothetical protein